MRIRLFNGLTPYLILTLGLSICTFLLLHRLGHDYIAQWDEVVHVNVVHNLYVDCCDPKLHTLDLTTDFEDTGNYSLPKGGLAWNNSYIWLHKPLLPFFVRAGLYHVFGESLLTFRLPAAVFALLTALSLFVIAKRFSSIWVATCVALLFANNPFIVGLVQGLQFSDLSDVMTVFFLTLVLGLTLASATGSPLLFLKSESAAAYWVASAAGGFFSALAYACKGGLALPGFAVFAIALVWQCGWGRGIRYMSVAVAAFGVLVLPGSLYLGHRFPMQFRYEQSHQIAHLFTNVEGWGNSRWHFYLTVYWPDLLGSTLGLLGFVAIMASLLSGLHNRRNTLLALWVLIYLVPLSFAVSKIANFILPVLPAVILLVGFGAYDLLQSERRALLFPLAGIAILAMTLYHFDILHFRALILADRAGIRFLLLEASLSIVLIFRLLSGAGKAIDLVPRLVSFRIAAAMAALMCFGVLIQNSMNAWSVSNSVPENYEEQMALKATAERMRAQIPQDAVVLVEEASAGDHRNAHLYFQYWSGVNSLPAQQLTFAKRTLSGTHPLYLLARDSLAGGALVEKVPFGYLYRIN